MTKTIETGDVAAYLDRFQSGLVEFLATATDEELDDAAPMLATRVE